MARTPRVTRTIRVAKVKVLCANVFTGETFTQEVRIARAPNNNEKMLEYVGQMLNTEQVKAIHITSVEVTDNVFGMSEQKFMENAELLTGRVKKVGAK